MQAISVTGCVEDNPGFAMTLNLQMPSAWWTEVTNHPFKDKRLFKHKYGFNFIVDDRKAQPTFSVSLTPDKVPTPETAALIAGWFMPDFKPEDWDMCPIEDVFRLFRRKF